MKQLILLIMTMFFTTFIFAGSKKESHRLHPINSFTTLQCTQNATVSSSGSYMCNGIRYNVTVTVTASASNDDCGTASQEASATATLLSSAAELQALNNGASSCNVT